MKIFLVHSGLSGTLTYFFDSLLVRIFNICVNMYPLRIEVFWNVTLCFWVSGLWCVKGLMCLFQWLNSTKNSYFSRTMEAAYSFELRGTSLSTTRCHIAEELESHLSSLLINTVFFHDVPVKNVHNKFVSFLSIMA